MLKGSRSSRRSFLGRGSLAAGGALMLRPYGKRLMAATNKLNIAVIGVAGRGGDNLNEVAHENIVALCDVDARHLAAAVQRHPSARAFYDFRRMLEGTDIDAVVIGTPDHTHAVCAVAALQTGRHVYCEKPLARTISEVRRMTVLAREHRRVTQMGTQIHAGSNYRRVVELVQSGAIGEVREVHVWVNAVYGGMNFPASFPPAPLHLHHDLWLGPIKHQPYHPEFVPFKWRNWWAFGGGSLADFGCHFMDLPHWALRLGHVASAEVMAGTPVHAHSTPPWLVVRYDHPARENRGPVELTWYHGGRYPERIGAERYAKWKSGVLFVGQKGELIADYGRHQLLPEKDFAGFKPPEKTIPDSIGHHREWIAACKGQGATTCPFEYGGPLSETALLGNVAYRAGSKILWDYKKMKALNTSSAAEFIHHEYRPGWSI